MLLSELPKDKTQTQGTPARGENLWKEPQRLVTSAAPSEGTGCQRGQGGFSLCLFAALLTFVSQASICPKQKQPTARGCTEETTEREWPGPCIGLGLSSSPAPWNPFFPEKTLVSSKPKELCAFR